MKTYNVSIKGQQSHISGENFVNQTETQVNAIIEKYWDEDYPKPQFDGESWELNNDQYITIEIEPIMEDLTNTLRHKKTGNGHFSVSIEMDGEKLSTTTTNTMAIDAAFDNSYDDDDNSGRFYETRLEAQEALVKEILRSR